MKKIILFLVIVVFWYSSDGKLMEKFNARSVNFYEFGKCTSIRLHDKTLLTIKGGMIKIIWD